jgi:hypothetical protein
MTAGITEFLPSIAKFTAALPDYVVMKKEMVEKKLPSFEV